MWTLLSSHNCRQSVLSGIGSHQHHGLSSAELHSFRAIIRIMQQILWVSMWSTKQADSVWTEAADKVFTDENARANSRCLQIIFRQDGSLWEAEKKSCRVLTPYLGKRWSVKNFTTKSVCKTLDWSRNVCTGLQRQTTQHMHFDYLVFLQRDTLGKYSCFSAL